MVGVAVPVSAVLAWILVHALHSALWYALVPIVALGCGALYAVSNISQDSQRDRDRGR
jgi:hypothetical protein